MKLYHHPLSGHSHRVRLFCALAGLPLDLVELDVLKGAHKSADYLKLNRFGQVPLLDDDGQKLAKSRDSQGLADLRADGITATEIRRQLGFA